MDIKNLKLTMANFSNGGAALCTDVRPDHPYDNTGHPDMGTISGQRVTVVFPANNYQQQVVRVSKVNAELPALVKAADPAHPVMVSFVGFSAAVYSMRGDDGRWRTGVSAKAEAVQVVDDDDSTTII